MARIALGHVAKEYPHKLDHVLLGDEDALPPRELHPIFFGSFDWHSCVHGWWTLLTLRRLFPDIAEAGASTSLANESFTREKVSAELAYLDRPLSRGFERPYGWAWLLHLHLEASRHEKRGADELEPLARAFADRLRDYPADPDLPDPRRHALQHRVRARSFRSNGPTASMPRSRELIRERARHWFGGDRDCQAWEPGGDEFLSPALIEALCMARAHPALFPIWFEHFLPRVQSREPATLCSRRRPSATAATARSPISTG